jgi:hypothetical protein
MHWQFSQSTASVSGIESIEDSPRESEVAGIFMSGGGLVASLETRRVLVVSISHDACGQRDVLAR